MGLKGGALLTGLVSLEEEEAIRALCLFPLWGHRKKTSGQEESLHQKPTMLHSYFELQVSRALRKKILFFNLPILWYSVRPTQANQDILSPICISLLIHSFKKHLRPSACSYCPQSHYPAEKKTRVLSSGAYILVRCKDPGAYILKILPGLTSWQEAKTTIYHVSAGS